MNNNRIEGLDPDLREQVASEYARLADALDAALANPTETALDELRHATDRLMRTTARIRLELERASRRG